MKTKMNIISFASILLLTSTTLSAAVFPNGHWYAGGTVTQAFVDERGFGEYEPGGKVYGGYKFNQYVGIEGSYYDFGELSNRSNQLKLDGISLAAVGSITVIPKLSVFAKVGAHGWNAKATGQIENKVGRNSDTELFYGLGVSYAATDHWQFRAEAENYVVDSLDEGAASIGAAFVF